MCYDPKCPTPNEPKSKTFLPPSAEIKANPLFNPELDMAPDGWHIKPMRLWAAKKQKRRMTEEVTDAAISELRNQRRTEYQALPEPKPNYFDWLAMVDEEERFWDAYKIRKNASFAGERLKAIVSVNEASKAKPKQTIEVTKEEGVNIDLLLEKILRAKGWNEDQAAEFMQKIDRVQ